MCRCRSDITKLGGISCNMQARHGIREELVRFRAGKSEESNHILGIENLFGNNTGGNELSGAGRINYDGLFERRPKKGNTI
jgi:hypothetical protein